MRKFTKYPSNYVKADSNYWNYANGEKIVICQYDKIVPVEFDVHEVFNYPTCEGYILTGVSVPTDFDVDLTGDMNFNTLPITFTNGKTIKISTLSELLSWLDNQGIRYKIDEYGLIVGGSEDGRIDDNLNLFFLEHFID